jgi:GNAT superfamily N-acetyltransferase
MKITREKLRELIKNMVEESDEDPHLKGLVDERGLQLDEREPILHNGEIAGFFTPQHNAKTGLSRLGAIYITPKYRRLGLAFKVLSEFSAHYPTIAFIDSTNVASREMYEKAGFVKGKYSAGDGYEGHWYYNDLADLILSS